MSFDQRQLRRWAARVLVVWLFGVVAGLAHACLLGEFDPDRPLPVAVNHQHHHHEHDQQSAGKPNCLDLCEKSSLTVPGGSFSLDKPDPGGAALPASFLPMPFVAHATAIRVPVAERPRPTLPISIAFLRLAL